MLLDKDKHGDKLRREDQSEGRQKQMSQLSPNEIINNDFRIGFLLSVSTREVGTTTP
jgi:hypothetical protein